MSKIGVLTLRLRHAPVLAIVNRVLEYQRYSLIIILYLLHIETINMSTYMSELASNKVSSLAKLIKSTCTSLECTSSLKTKMFVYLT